MPSPKVVKAVRRFTSLGGKFDLQMKVISADMSCLEKVPLVNKEGKFVLALKKQNQMSILIPIIKLEDVGEKRRYFMQLALQKEFRLVQVIELELLQALLI